MSEQLSKELQAILNVASAQLSEAAFAMCVPYAEEASPEIVAAALAGACVHALTRLSRSYARAARENIFTQEEADQHSRDAVIYVADIILRSCRANGINVVYTDEGGTPQRATMQ